MGQAEFSAALQPECAPVVPSPRPNSFGIHARISELEQKLVELRKEYAGLHTVLFEAAQVHRRLCAPRLVRYGSFEILSEIFAVRHLAGDFFTVEEEGDGVIFALGDISGKGLAAGMWTTLLVGLIGMQKTTGSDLQTIVAGVNNELCARSPIAPMASLFLARLDPAAGVLDYCSAGHPPAFLLRAGGQFELLSDGGPILAAIPGASYGTGRVEMQAGDVLLLYSDGIIEARDSGDEEFGQTRLMSQLRLASGEGVDDILFSVLGAVRDFAAQDLADDTTLVVVRRNS